MVRLDMDGLLGAAVDAGADGALAVKRLANEVASEPGGAQRLDAGAFARLLAMESAGQLTTAQARTVLKVLLDEGGEPADIAGRLGFEAMGADALTGVVDAVIAASPDEWARYCAGEDKLTGFFVGKVKAATAGQADLKAATALLRQRRG